MSKKFKLRRRIPVAALSYRHMPALLPFEKRMVRCWGGWSTRRLDAFRRTRAEPRQAWTGATAPPGREMIVVQTAAMSSSVGSVAIEPVRKRSCR